MPQLLFAPASPYSSKVRMAAIFVGVHLDCIQTDTGAEPEHLLSRNPLGKIPVLITDDGQSIYDSRVIARTLDRLSGTQALFPQTDPMLRAERLEALADGLCDCLLAHVYERRVRPQGKVHEPWLDKQWAKARRAIDHLEEEPPASGSKITGGEIALRAAIGYLDLRFAGHWEQGRTRLRTWSSDFDRQFPELVACLPQ